jgi:molecular chaperone GrpE (heat shock protein)
MLNSRLEMEEAHGYVCDCTRNDPIEALCHWCRMKREDQQAEERNMEQIDQLNDKIGTLEKELLAKDAEIADLTRKNAALQIEAAHQRAYADRIDCHLRDAKANIVLLMSKIQEFEAREY